jgi:hypothetical protein
MAIVKILAGWISGGALLGLIVASFLGPKWLGWYNSVGITTGQQALCDVPKLTDEITHRLLVLQAEGALAGGIIALGVGIFVVVKNRKSPPPAAAAPA